MRLRFFLFAILIAAPAGAQTAVDFAAKNLATSKDSRVRASSAVLLGTTHSPKAVQPLCAGLKDPETIVRSACATALGELGDVAAIPCLKNSSSDSDNGVRSAVGKALDQIAISAAVKPGAMYVLLDPLKDETGGLSPSDLKLALDLLQKKLVSLGLAVALPGWDTQSATALVKSKRLKGWLLKVKVLPHPSSSNGLKLDLLALTFPDNAIKGQVNVKASGAKPAQLFPVMVPRLVDDAADEFEWSPQ